MAAPETQTVAINGTAAQFDGSDSYTDEEMPITDWAWDFDGDGEDDYSEHSGQQGRPEAEACFRERVCPRM